MPSKKKSSKSASHDDPDTMMSKSSAPVPGTADEKPVKKKKLTKAEKDLAKLEKSCDTFRKSGKPFRDFLERMDTWLKKNSKKLIKLCKALDPELESAVTYDEFKSILFDLGAPCSRIEVHLLCQLLDVEEEEAIDYAEIDQGIKIIRERMLSHEYSDYRPVLSPTPGLSSHCPSCKLAVWDGHTPTYPRYMLLHLRLVTFDGSKHGAGHLDWLTHSHITVQAVMDHIREHTSLLSTRLAVFRDKSRSSEALLPPSAVLEDLGYPTGPRQEPAEVTLYYDYVVEFTDCPLLMCDHYF